jgi:hypothetical protein
MQPGTQAFELLPELHQPAGSFSLLKPPATASGKPGWPPRWRG